MILKGAAKTLTEKPTQTHPRIRTRLDPDAKKKVRSRIRPNTPTFKSISILAVKICIAPHLSKLKKKKLIRLNKTTWIRMLIYVYLSLSWCVYDVHGDVGGFYNTADGVDGDEKGSFCFEACVVDPQHCTKKCNYVRHRLETFG